MTTWCWCPAASTAATSRRRSCARPSTSGTTRCAWDRWRSAPSGIGCWRRAAAAVGGSGRSEQGVWNGAAGSARADRRRAAPPPAAVAVVEAEVVAAAIGAPEPLEETPAPSDAVPIQSAPEASAATVSVSIGDDVPTDRLLGAIESVKGALAGRPGRCRCCSPSPSPARRARCGCRTASPGTSAWGRCAARGRRAGGRRAAAGGREP